MYVWPASQRRTPMRYMWVFGSIIKKPWSVIVANNACAELLGILRRSQMLPNVTPPASDVSILITARTRAADFTPSPPLRVVNAPLGAPSPTGLTESPDFAITAPTRIVHVDEPKFALSSPLILHPAVMTIKTRRAESRKIVNRVGQAESAQDTHDLLGVSREIL